MGKKGGAMHFAKGPAQKINPAPCPITPLKGKFQLQNNNTVQNKGLQVKQSSQQPLPMPHPPI